MKYDYDKIKKFDFADFKNEIIKSITGKVGDEELVLKTATGKTIIMYHEVNCFDRVWLEDICGDLKDLIETPILVAEKLDSQHETLSLDYFIDGIKSGTVDFADIRNQSQTYSFYTMRTRKGSVTLRWCGSSNGCYSEEVDIVELI